METKQSEIPKVLVCEPIYLGLHPSVYVSRIKFWSKLQVHRTLGDYKVNPLVIGPRENIRTARTKAIREAMKSAATHVLFMDDDIQVPENILEELLVVNKDIVGGLMHKDDGTPIVFRDPDAPDGKGVQDTSIPGKSEIAWIEHPRSAAFECAAVGAGCMLVKTSVFVQVITRFSLFTGMCFNYDETPRTMDVRFCRMARTIGKEVWCLPDPPCIQIPHY